MRKILAEHRPQEKFNPVMFSDEEQQLACFLTEHFFGIDRLEGIADSIRDRLQCFIGTPTKKDIAQIVRDAVGSENSIVEELEELSHAT